MSSATRTRPTFVNMSWWLFIASGCCLYFCPPLVQGQSGDVFVEAIVSHLKISPFLVNLLNSTSYPHGFYVQDNVELVNVTVANLLNLRREGPWDLLVDSDGLMHLRGALNLSDVRLRAGYRYHRWLTTFNGRVSLRLPQITLQLHATLANLTSMGLRTFRVAGMVPPQVMEFTGTTTLFNWIGARRLQNLMDASTNTLVENLENFVRNGVSSLMEENKYSQVRCDEKVQGTRKYNKNKTRQQYIDSPKENLETILTLTDYTIPSNGTGSRKG